MPPIIPIYPGSKRLRMYRQVIFGDRYQWDAVLEPFVGGGATSLYAWANHRFIADVAPDILSIWRAWIDGHWGKVREAIADYQAISKTDPQAAWDKAKARYELLALPGVELAVVSLVLRKLAFGGVLRTNADDELTVSPHSSKVKPFLNWKSNPPAPGPGWTVKTSWQDAVEAWREAGIVGDTLVLLDPPYYLPYGPGTERRGTGLMTPAYPGHKPHSDETWGLATNPIAAVAKDPRATRIVIFNYYSYELDQAIGAIAGITNRSLKDYNFERMSRMNNGNGKAKVKANEYAWVMGAIDTAPRLTIDF